MSETIRQKVWAHWANAQVFQVSKLDDSAKTIINTLPAVAEHYQCNENKCEMLCKDQV